MTAVALELGFAFARLGLRTWQRHLEARKVDASKMTEAEMLAEVERISIGDADALIEEGAASTATG